MLVSVIINNFNYERFLCAAIDSALGQTYDSVEVIVVDDGSTDQSRVTIDRYGDRVTAVLKPNGGQSSALNAGFAQSHGDIVIFLDADDVLLPHAAQAVVEAFNAQRNVAKVQYRMAVIDRHGRPTGEIKPPPHIPLPAGDLRRSEMNFPFDLAWLPTSGNAFSAPALRRILPIPTDYGSVGADWYLAHVAALLGQVVSLDEVCACYRVHGHNSYELTDHILDLEHVHRTIVYAAQTEIQIERYARQLGFDVGGRTIARGLSVSSVANRMISLKLDPAFHPIQKDNVWRLFRLGVIAARGRFDVKWPMQLMFVGWFLAMAVAPRSIARWLAERFLYPEKRTGLNHVLRTFHAENS